ncbi:hypothetical protein HNR23_000799 [Nocardiopsis mwathae]|uniref:Uncharacterized protein n=1 Tax=Nocardiopsis mwathae TaxID=1472723 RepID=A0A7W9YEM0_9ACTN|nr:hypothetical protein [Nocardiopsis mwathae]
MWEGHTGELQRNGQVVISITFGIRAATFRGRAASAAAPITRDVPTENGSVVRHARRRVLPSRSGADRLARDEYEA